MNRELVVARRGYYSTPGAGEPSFEVEIYLPMKQPGDGGGFKCRVVAGKPGDAHELFASGSDSLGALMNAVHFASTVFRDLVGCEFEGDWVDGSGEVATTYAVEENYPG